MAELNRGQEAPSSSHLMAPPETYESTQRAPEPIPVPVADSGPETPPPAPSGDEVVIGASQSTNEVLVRDEQTKEAYWKPATTQQMNRVVSAIAHQEQMGATVSAPKYELPPGVSRGRSITGSMVSDPFATFGDRWQGKIEGDYFIGTDEEFAAYEQEYELLMNKPVELYTWRGDVVEVPQRDLRELVGASGKTQFDGLVGLGVIEKGSQYVPTADGWGYYPKSQIDKAEAEAKLHIKPGGAIGGEKPPTTEEYERRKAEEKARAVAKETPLQRITKDLTSTIPAPLLASGGLIAIAEPTPIGEGVMLTILLLAGGVAAIKYYQKTGQIPNLPKEALLAGQRAFNNLQKQNVSLDNVTVIDSATGESTTVSDALRALTPVQGKIIEVPPFPIYHLPSRKQEQERSEGLQSVTERDIRAIGKSEGLTQVRVKSGSPPLGVDPEVIRKIGEREPTWRVPVIVIGTGGSRLVVPRSMFDAAQKTLAERAGVMLAAQNTVAVAEKAGIDIGIDWDKELTRIQITKVISDAAKATGVQISAEVRSALQKSLQEYARQQTEYLKSLKTYEAAREAYVGEFYSNALPISQNLTLGAVRTAVDTEVRTKLQADPLTALREMTQMATQTADQTATEATTEAVTQTEAATKPATKAATKAVTATRVATRAATREATRPAELTNVAEADVTATAIATLKLPKLKGRGAGSGEESRLPVGSLTWRQGALWKWIPPEDFVNGAKPRTLPRGATPAGARIGGQTPQETLQVLGDSGAIVPDIQIDLGKTDAFITGQGRVIQFSGRGGQTNVGERIPSAMQGMSVGSGYGISRPEAAIGKAKKRQNGVTRPEAGESGAFLDEEPGWLTNLDRPVTSRGKSRVSVRKRTSRRTAKSTELRTIRL